MKLISTNGKRQMKKEIPKMGNMNIRSRRVKKPLALLIAMLMVMSLLPLNAFADTPNPSQIKEYGSTIYYDRDGDTTGVTEENFVVSTSKTISETGLDENEFEITLQVRTTVDVSEIEVEPDAAVVLVIDISGSMANSPMGFSTQRSTEYSVPMNPDAAEMTVYATSKSVGTQTGKTVYLGSNGYYYAADSSNNNEWRRLTINTGTAATQNANGRATQQQRDYNIPLTPDGANMDVFISSQARIYDTLARANSNNTTNSATNRPIYTYNGKYYASRSNTGTGSDWYEVSSVVVGGATRWYFTTTTLPIPESLRVYGSWAGSTQTLAIPASKTRIEEAKAAAIAFLDSYVTDAGDAARMVSIVTFATTSDVRPINGQNWVDVTDSANLAAAKTIINGLSATGGTFTQGGLMHARNLYLPANAPNVDGSIGTATRTVDNPVIANRFVVMLTDGNPTYSNSSNTSAALSQLTRSTGSNDGGGSEDILSVSVGSNRAATVAAQIKNGTFTSNSTNNYTANLYTIGFGIANTTFRRDGTTSGTTGAITGNEWLERIADKHYPASNANDLNIAFEKISETIIMMANAWKVTDPMADYIKFSGFTTQGDGTFSEAGGTITWDIRFATPVTTATGQRDGNTTIYTYELKYKVTLDNLVELVPPDGDGRYQAEDNIPTNDRTTLTYVVDNKKADEYNETDFHTVDFTIPEVLGFDTEPSAQFNFDKVDPDGAPIKDAVFNLYLNATATGAPFASATSLDSGVVNFGALPSGHTYYLKEIEAPEGYVLDDTIYRLDVNYGKLTVVTENGALAFNNNNNRYTFTNVPSEQGATISFTKLYDGDGFSGRAPRFEFKVYTNVACTDIYDIAAVNGVVVTGGTVNYRGHVRIEISDVLPLIPAGATYTSLWIKEVGTETLANGGRWTHATNAVEITVSNKGEVKYPENWDRTFTNTFTQLYTVTVNYFVKGASDTTYRRVNSMTVVQTGYEDGDPYTFANIEAAVSDSIRYRGNNYYFDRGFNRDTLNRIFNADYATNLEGVINGSNVVINLYYSRIALPSIPLTKFIDKYIDTEYPDDYSFTFALYIANGSGGYTKVTNDLTFSKDEVFSIGDTGAVAKNFVWNLPRGMRPADLRSETLYIREGALGTGWINEDGLASDYIAYGRLNRLVGFTPAQAFANLSTTNTYRQYQDDAVITLHKFFEGNGVELIPEFDGAVLDCDAEHTHGDGNCELDYDNPVCGLVEHVHDAECYDPDDQLICGYDYEHVHDDSCYVCTIPEHEHDDYCYAYEFTFTLTAKNGDEVVYTHPETIKISYADMLALLSGDKSFETVTFTIPSECLPTPGSGSVLSVSIVEGSENFNWVPAVLVEGIIVDPYGHVTYPAINNQTAYNAEMTNVFDGITVPSFSFAKTVVDARSILGSIASYYTGDFTFDLYDGEALVDTITLTAVKGIAAGTFTLPQYIETEYAELTLRERIPEVVDRVPNMSYDGRDFSIVIENGTVTQVNPIGRLNKIPIIFVNSLLDPIEPVATVNKWVNTETEAETFTFGWSYEGFMNETLFNPVPVSDSGEATITVNSGEDHFFSIPLPVNFTGRLTIVEDTDAVKANWEYDSNDTRTIDYVLGVPAGRQATGTVAFTNNFYVPEIELTKTASAESVVLYYEDIVYTITVENVGAEDLRNAVIHDAMFNDTVVVTDPAAEPSVLVDGEDYILDLDAGTITLLADLKQGDKIFISYTVVPYETGAIENVATVSAERTITMGDNVSDRDVETVVVTRYAAQLSVSKDVTAYIADMDLESESIVWNPESITFLSSGNRAAFRVTIRNTGEGVLWVTDITDFFASADLSGATFFYSNGEGLVGYEGLEALLGAIREVSLYNGDGEIVFYIISDALTTRGTFTNTVTVTAYDSYEERYESSDSASVIVSWNDIPVDPDYGTLAVTKQFSGVDSVPGNWSATITISGPGGTQSKTITSINRTASFGGLTAGTYTVSETDASGITNYAFVGVEGEGAYNVTVNNITSVTITNTYSADSNTGDIPEATLEEEGPPLAMLPPDDEDILDDMPPPLSDMPQTGDTSSTAPWAFGLFASLMGVGALLGATVSGKNKGKHLGK